jgi:membrane fusion protein, adhesin transport system
MGTATPAPPASAKPPGAPARTVPKPAQLRDRSLRNRIRRFFHVWMAETDTEAVDWMDDADRALLEQEPLRARGMLYVVAAVLVLLIGWSSVAELDQVTRGEGKVIPSQQVQIVQSVDGGVVTEILTKEGRIVEAGELLVRLDATRFTSNLRESAAELMALQAKSARLRAVTSGKPFEIEPALTAAIPDVVAQEKALYDSMSDELRAGRTIAEQQLGQREQERVGLVAKLEQARRGLELASQELKVTRPLLKSGSVSEVEILRLEREVAQMRGERDQVSAQISQVDAAISEARRKVEEFELTFLNQQREALSEVTARINSLQEGNAGLSDRVKQTDIRSPVRGTVKRLFQNTIGGVVQPGKEVCEIVPLDDTLLLEARVKPKDIAFLRPGQSALVKFTAYDFVIYGGLEAVVDHIGADTVMDEKGNPFYTVRVRTLESSLGDEMPIIPGMVAEVDVLTGKKTVLASLLKPILRARQYALTER